ncbi:Cytochrome P450 [Canna indica]|uniref:Cytochrome P450 n=1 Tax=Canna indica TaxID=4628 RepID=A0AAQ3Q6V0_9LILI|nr:Cytochrome P450 [Canna indica]
MKDEFLNDLSQKGQASQFGLSAIFRHLTNVAPTIPLTFALLFFLVQQACRLRPHFIFRLCRRCRRPSWTSLLLLLLLPCTTLSLILLVALIAFSVLCFFPGDLLHLPRRSRVGTHVRSIPGPLGFVSALSCSVAHRVLMGLAHSLNAVDLMAFPVGFTRFVVSSHPNTTKEILNSSAFADRPIKESAYELLFHRAMGFAPFGEYWRNLRRISSTYLFSPWRIATFGEHRRVVGEQMVADIRNLMAKHDVGKVKKVLHFGSLNNVMMSLMKPTLLTTSTTRRELSGSMPHCSVPTTTSSPSPPSWSAWA